MHSKERKISNYICSQFLRCIRFDPSSVGDSYVSGIPQTRTGFGGLGYSYWKSYATMALHDILPAIRKASLTDLSLSEAQKLLDNFCSLHINSLISGNFQWQIGRGSLSDRLTDEQKEHLRGEFFLHLAEFTREKWYWIPLNSICGANYRGKSLYLTDSPESPDISPLEMSEFLRKPMFENAAKFAGLKARNAEHAKEKLGVLLGAMFLCMYSGTHFSHTMGKPVRGVLFFEGGKTIHSSRTHLPFLANEIEIAEADFPMLERVEELLQSGEENRKLIRSLRWLSASWFANGAERFSLLCQSIDALTPSGYNTMRAKCGWICEQLGGIVPHEPIDLLFKKIRSDVAHGDAPSLIESPTYLEFLAKYGVDPELAAVEIVRKVLIDNFIPQVLVRRHPILAYPDFIEREKRIFARYGMDYTVPIGFDFSKLSA